MLIELQHFNKQDIPQLIGWIHSSEFLLQWAGLSMKYPLDEEQLTDYIKAANHEKANLFAFKVVHLESGKTIGHISIGSIDRINGTARICRVLVGDDSMLGKGIGRLMMLEALKIAFGRLKLHKVSLAVFDFNKPAIRLYEQIGFKTEGFIREACKIGNQYWSYYEMSMLVDEWQEIVTTIKE